jgi:hypothetical protein
MFTGRLDRNKKTETMALTEYQIAILRLLSERRKREGVSYIAGGAALNDALKASRWSNDIDILPVENIGACILKKDSITLYTESGEQLARDLAGENIMFHQGCIGGAWPKIA